MSRGFVKEDDLELAGTDLPERPISEHPNYVTPFGLKQLQTSEQHLLEQREQLAKLQDQPQAAQQLAMVERDLRYVQSRLEQAILVHAPSVAKETVVFGATVTVEDEQGDAHIFHIVGEDEADLSINKVSYVSPLAKALLGHKVGDSVTWRRPAGNMLLTITQIHY
jgi:transcription elongation factor GreB